MSIEINLFSIGGVGILPTYGNFGGPGYSNGQFNVGLQGIEWVILGIAAAEKPVDRGFLKL